MKREICISIPITDRRVRDILVNLISKCKDCDFDSINLADYSSKFEQIK